MPAWVAWLIMVNVCVAGIVWLAVPSDADGAQGDGN